MKLSAKPVMPSVFLSAVICVTLCLTGCFSLEHAKSDSSNEDQVIVRNYGWRLFYVIPIVCGNSNENSKIPWVFFRNDVTMDKIQSRLVDFAARNGKTAGDLVYDNYDTVMWSIPIVELPIPIPYLLCYNEIQLSARLK